ncbi:MAG: type II toxin-antitoxin system VapC family toxin [Spirochaetota bacterium]
MTRGSVLFLDTNVLLAATDRSRREHSNSRAILREAETAGCHLACTPQIIREYLVVASRPVDVNGLGMSAADALANVQAFRTRLTVVDESSRALQELLSLVATHDLTGKRIHDANIAAAMAAHGLDILVTSNGDDFRSLFLGRIVGPSECLAELRVNLA